MNTCECPYRANDIDLACSDFARGWLECLAEVCVNCGHSKACHTHPAEQGEKSCRAKAEGYGRIAENLRALRIQYRSKLTLAEDAGVLEAILALEAEAQAEPSACSLQSAEDMRERYAQACEDAVSSLGGMVAGQFECASIIRSLPPTAPTLAEDDIEDTRYPNGWEWFSYDTAPPIGEPVFVANEGSDLIYVAAYFRDEHGEYWARHRQERGAINDIRCFEQSTENFDYWRPMVGTYRLAKGAP